MNPISQALLATVFAQTADFRPPAVPLIAHDPYFSVWSFADRLNEGTTRHWTGADHPLSSLVRLDGHTYRLMGIDPAGTDALPQTGLKVWPTRTVYTFAGAGVEVRLTFTTPSLPDDIEVLSRPTTYLTWEVRATDGKSHDASVYFSADARLAVNEGHQTVLWNRTKAGSLNTLRIGSEDQPVLQKRGDNLRIDWGHLLVAGSEHGYIGTGAVAMADFMKSGHVPSVDQTSMARAAGSDLVAAFAIPLGSVGSASVSRHLVVAYDDEYSIQFMGHNLQPYWRRNGMDGRGLLEAAERDYSSLTKRCEAFDKELVTDVANVGGVDYVNIACLAFRQSFAAQKVVADANGQPLMFSKENFSNGCIGTVDVLYPAAPQLLLFSPTLTKASLVPIMEYAASSRWKWPFAPHDLGQYPKANGQVYGGGEHTEDDQMPVEETGNMILLLAALAHQEGNATFSEKYWPQLSKWAEYLAKEGFDPANQLCTDDFAGHLAHNVNLSAKAIEGLGAYAYLADNLGKHDEATKYQMMAKSFADRWVTEGLDGDHYKLAFDKPGSWSQKYNLVWDRIIGLNLFPTSVFRQEMDYYHTKLNPYGLPLDSRRDYTKLDWEIWTATLTGERSDFDAITSRVANFLNSTPDRIPMTDWGYTSQPRHEGFQARSVVGGVFIKMLDTPLWTKYASRDADKAGPWASLPKPPVVTEVVPSALTAASEWSYTMEKPADGWFGTEFDTSTWKKGAGAFGEGPNRGGNIRTPWSTADIWVRREFDVPMDSVKDLQLTVSHDDGAEVYINGTFVIHLPNAAGYETYDLPKAVRASLKAKGNVIAIHCHDDGGDKYIDAGLVTVKLTKD